MYTVPKFDIKMVPVLHFAGWHELGATFERWRCVKVRAEASQW